jgi:hypothetical protein
MRRKMNWPAAVRERFCASFQASLLVLACLSVAGPALAQTAYDGGWTVAIMTQAGSCSSGLQFGVQIVNGQVVSAAGGAASVSGQVGPGGAVRVTVQGGGQWASGSGQLSAVAGSGVWRGQGNAGACSGTWTAQRTTAQTVAVGPRGPINNYGPGYAAAPGYAYTPNYAYAPGYAAAPGYAYTPGYAPRYYYQPAPPGGPVVYYYYPPGYDGWQRW